MRKGGLMNIYKYGYYKDCLISDRRFDVIVVGGGTAGATAAIASAMSGASVLVVERSCCLGGSSSGGQVTPMMHTGIPGNADSSFINTMIKERLIKENFGVADAYENNGWTNPEMLKFILEELLLEYGGHILYETDFIDIVKENSIIKGIVVHNKAGIQVMQGDMIIDCSGDADVAYSSGVQCFTGNEKDCRNQLTSLRFMLGNVDILKLHSYMRSIGEPMALDFPMIEIASIWESENPLCNIFKKAVDDGVLHYDDGRYFQAFSVAGMPGVMSFNCPEIQDMYDSIDPWSRTGIIIEGKRAIRRLWQFLKSYLPGFEDSCIISVASIPGVRESRRIKGRYVLSAEDYNLRARFDDAIARSAYPVDIHGLEEEMKTDIRPLERGEFFEIPFGCLVPLETDNLLVAGRCISSTFTAQSSIRIQAICRATGEAAGIAAAYCAKNKLKVKEFDGRMAREIMKQHGAFL